MSIVVDASMAAAWLFEDERTEAAFAVFAYVTANGAVVPSLWKLEIANLLRTAERRGRCTEALADALLDRLQSLPIDVDRETDTHAWHTTRALSRQYGLTPYDAAYLELAVRRGLPLATGDRKLIPAGRQCNVSIISP